MSPLRNSMHSSEVFTDSSKSVQNYIGPDSTNDLARIKSDVSIASRNRTETEIAAEQDELARIVTETDVLDRYASLARTLSTHRVRDGSIRIDPEDFDLRRVLETIVSHCQNEGIRMRSTGVTFRDMTAFGLDIASSRMDTVGTVLESIVTLPKILFSKKPPLRKIISGVDGIGKPGEMILVLGRPGAGCSTFLRTISGETRALKGTAGDIRFNNIPQATMLKRYKNDVIYNPELDVHLPHLTVDQTLRFAIACKTPRVRARKVTREQYICVLRDILATTFGLRHTYNTKVGNDFVRGVSGGERKRVSIAEALAARAQVYCWDNATRGLDASTALEYTQAIRAATNLLGNVAFITIYQAGENIYETFDKVTVLYSGRQIYFGPVTEARAYFERLGFEPIPRQTTAEFLTSVTDELGRRPKPGWEARVPKTAEEFAAVWENSPERAALLKEIDEYNANVSAEETLQNFDASWDQEKMKGQRCASRYTTTFFTQLQLLVRRGFQRIHGEMAFTVAEIAGSVIQGLVVGSLFYSIPDTTAGNFSRASVIFFGIMYFALLTLAEVSNTFDQRPIIRKHASYSFYHPAAQPLSEIFTNLPVKALSIIVFGLLVYFMAGLKREAGAFFMYLLFIYLVTLGSAGMFQVCATYSPGIAPANAVAGVLIMALIVYSGFMINKPSMHPWFSWISWLDVAFYAFESLMASEFHGLQIPCDESSLVPRGAAYNDLPLDNRACAVVGAVAGQDWVSGDQFVELSYSYKYSHVWRNFGILIGFWVFFEFLIAIGAEYYQPEAPQGDKLVFKSSGAQKAATSGSRDSENNSDSSDSEKPSAEAAVDLRSKDIFSWQHVDYVIPLAGSTRKLLDDVQGYVKPGTLTALMGESGAGKTTLLNALSQRIHFGIITGDMLVNGRPVDASFQRRTGYVQQQDLHVSELTVRESLYFAARLRRPETVPDAEKIAYCDQMMHLLGMDSYADAIVGESGAGLNVEQKKKLSICVELVAKPSLLLFLDEPTSGLDSQSAWSIVLFLKKLAAAGQAILCTIHQPSATLFQQFDRLLLLKKGGQTVYFGDIGPDARTVLNYFESHGARKCLDCENPAEYILEAIGAGATASTDRDWAEVWRSSEDYANVTAEVTALNAELASRPVATDKELTKRYAVRYICQLKQMYIRTALQLWRDPTYTMSKFFLHIFAGLFIGFSFWNADSSIIGMQNVMFAIYQIVIISFPFMNQIESRAIASREVYEVREKESNTYHWSLLPLTQFMAEVPYVIVGGTITYCCAYFCLKINNTADIAGVFWLHYSVLFQIFYLSFGLWIIYFSPNLPTALIFTSVFVTFVVSFCGVFQPESLMPGFWTFMWKVSPYTYFIQSLLGIALHNKPVICTSKELTQIVPPSGMTCGEYLESFLEAAIGYLVDPNATNVCEYCSLSVGDEYLATLGIYFSDRWRNFGFYFAYIGFNLVAMVAMFYYFRIKGGNPIKSVMGFVRNLKGGKNAAH